MTLAPVLMTPFAVTPFTFTPTLIAISAAVSAISIPNHNGRRRNVYRRRRVVARHADTHGDIDMSRRRRRYHQHTQPQYRTQDLLIHLVSPRT